MQHACSMHTDALNMHVTCMQHVCSMNAVCMQHASSIHVYIKHAACMYAAKIKNNVQQTILVLCNKAVAHMLHAEFAATGKSK